LTSYALNFFNKQKEVVRVTVYVSF